MILLIVKSMDTVVRNGFYSGCFFDVCSYEGNATQTKAQLCASLQKFNDECMTLGMSLGNSWTFDWRTKYGCCRRIFFNYFDK